MAVPVDIGDLLNRAKRDVERARFRARNGIRLIVGRDQPYVGLTPRDEVWARDKVRLYRYHGDHRALQVIRRQFLLPLLVAVARLAIEAGLLEELVSSGDGSEGVGLGAERGSEDLFHGTILD